MNIFVIEKCGHITENDPFAIMVQGLSMEQAKQIVLNLVHATRSDCHARFMGMLPDGSIIPESYGNWVTRYEDVKAKLDQDLVKQP